MTQMTEDALRALVDNELYQAMGGGWSGKLTSQRQRGLQAYMGEAVGDFAPPEVEGRSTVVDSSVRDTVDMIMPALMKMFTASDEAVKFTPKGPGDEKKAEDATNYANWVFYTQNSGWVKLFTFIKDGLIQKNGILKVWWDERIEEEREEYEGLNLVQLHQLMQDDKVEIIDQTEKPVEDAQMAMAMQQMGLRPIVYDVAVKRTKNNSQICIENVPPEEFLIGRKARDLDFKDVTFCAHRRLYTHSDLLAMGYSKSQIDNIGTDDNWGDQSPEAIQRIKYDDDLYQQKSDSSDPSMKQSWVSECYMRVDFDGDGIAEWRKVTKAGSTILDNEECDGPCFATWTPKIMPHRFFGLSTYDDLGDIQKIQTSLKRSLNDNIFLQNNIRYLVKDAGVVNIDDLLNSRPGGVVRTKDMEAVKPLETPQIADRILPVIQFYESQRVAKSGVVHGHNMNDADSLNKGPKTATQIGAEDAHNNERIELIGRTLAETGVKRLFMLILKLASQYADEAANFQINGTWMTVNPREWKTGFDLQINVGLGTGMVEAQSRSIIGIMDVQKEFALHGLPMVGPQQLYNSAKRLTQVGGFKSPDEFFIDPKTIPPKPPEPPKPDPEMVKIQAASQAKAQEMQMSFQLDQQRAQMEMAQEQHKQEMQAQQVAHQNMIEAQRDQLQAQLDAQVEERKSQSEAMMKAQELESKRVIEDMKLHFDAQARTAQMDFDRWKTEFEGSIKLQVADLTSQKAIDEGAQEASDATGQEIVDVLGKHLDKIHEGHAKSMDAVAGAMNNVAESTQQLAKAATAKRVIKRDDAGNATHSEVAE
jgi:hypothetical protein